ncbi:hypothetical protein CLV59_104146 [Chitinophaga dinghuensis]|uniref:Wadjet protein JetD C-terminal domain-containing protein n=1 Tax=Chitinophaga dinghuensis TaxID=1539050 RepID=A0A327VY07_9BACT|nr:Wadjet anti-phage system protein JetD domain-containing protein [Chitinophaga dinghuensis]RAJ81921.1 hypothetical protein CLV59_104146 [Chitinophaga dinghuensis]
MFKTYEELRKKVKNEWNPLLRSYLSGEEMFPVEMKTGSATVADYKHQLAVIDENITSLLSHSKNVKGKGYLLTLTKRDFKDRMIAPRTEPVLAIWETTEDLIYTLEKEKEWKRFVGNVALIREVLPALESWMMENCKELTVANRPWAGLLDVCNYFLRHPRPNVFSREVPHLQDTKFMENHESILRSLLDFLIPEHIRDSTASKLEKRYYLRYSEKMVHLRSLDKSVKSKDGFDEKQVPTASFIENPCYENTVLILENQKCLESLPELPSTLAVKRYGGVDVKFFKEVPWLKDKRIFYWGDIDEHGFQILHNLRTYGLDVTSVMMDLQTYMTFKEHAVSGERVEATSMVTLTKEEAAMLEYLQCHREENRLEQEKIRHSYTLEKFKSIYVKTSLLI